MDFVKHSKYGITLSLHKGSGTIHPPIRWILSYQLSSSTQLETIDFSKSRSQLCKQLWGHKGCMKGDPLEGSQFATWPLRGIRVDPYSLRFGLGDCSCDLIQIQRFCVKILTRYSIIFLNKCRLHGSLRDHYTINCFVLIVFMNSDPIRSDPSCMQSSTSLIKQFYQSGRKQSTSNLYKQLCSCFCLFPIG